jgi:hypothetical protein
MPGSSAPLSTTRLNGRAHRMASSALDFVHSAVPKWFANCAPFLRRQVELVGPIVVVACYRAPYNEGTPVV